MNKLPTLAELVEDTEMSVKDNALTVILNQPPPDGWLKTHPVIKNYSFLPIERVEWLMTRIFGKWSVTIKDVKVLANSVTVTLTVTVKNPVTRDIESQDGVGACPIQTDKGAGAMDWNAAKADGVMKALPAAESYAFKDACEKWGKIFGKDLGRKDTIGYESLLKQQPEDLYQQLCDLWEFKQSEVPANQFTRIEEIINAKEKSSYQKSINYLKSL